MRSRLPAPASALDIALERSDRPRRHASGSTINSICHRRGPYNMGAVPVILPEHDAIRSDLFYSTCPVTATRARLTNHFKSDTIDLLVPASAYTSLVTLLSGLGLSLGLQFSPGHPFTSGRLLEVLDDVRGSETSAGGLTKTGLGLLLLFFVLRDVCEIGLRISY